MDARVKPAHDKLLKIGPNTLLDLRIRES